MSTTALIYQKAPRMRRVRRAVDIAVAGTALLVASPILAAAAAAILIEDGGSPLFVQRRVGRFERLFDIYKLRTMRKRPVTDELSPTDGRDPRITRVGYWLRKTSIDELPQLFNVLNGTMSLIGPRPEMPFLVRRFERQQHLRHLAVPGITGLWQIRARSTVPLHLPAATEIDLEYITTASPRNDVAIIFNTFRSVFSAHGAY